MEKQEWVKLVETKSEHYLNLGDGGFDELMHWNAKTVFIDTNSHLVALSHSRASP